MNRLDLTLHSDGIAVVTLTDPPVNAMDASLLEELTGVFEGLGAETAVRAAVITGQGRAFSAGLNLKTVPNLDHLGQRRLTDRRPERLLWHALRLAEAFGRRGERPRRRGRPDPRAVRRLARGGRRAVAGEPR